MQTLPILHLILPYKQIFITFIHILLQQPLNPLIAMRVQVSIVMRVQVTIAMRVQVTIAMRVQVTIAKRVQVTDYLPTLFPLDTGMHVV